MWKDLEKISITWKSFLLKVYNQSPPMQLKMHVCYLFKSLLNKIQLKIPLWDPQLSTLHFTCLC